MTDLSTLTNDWQQVGDVKDQSLIAALRLEPDKYEMRLQGSVVEARLAQPKPKPLPKLDVPAPRFGLVQAESWKEGDGPVRGMFDAYPSGHKFVDSVRWLCIRDERLVTVDSPVPENMSREELFCSIFDLAGRASMPLTIEGKTWTASDLLALSGYDMKGRWADGAHRLMQNYVGLARRTGLYGPYLDDSILVASERRSTPWVVNAVAAARLRTWPWRPGWCPSREVRQLLERGSLMRPSYSAEAERTHAALFAGWSAWEAEQAGPSIAERGRRALKSLQPGQLEAEAEALKRGWS